MHIKTFIEEWLASGNAFDTVLYLEKYCEDAVLDDPSVGRKFVGHKEIREYFTSYFIGYETQTKMVKLGITASIAYLEVEFTGTFPEGKIGGSFDFTFKEGKIQRVIADLV